MSYAPKTVKDFSNPAYWKQFFEKRKTPFEWYGEYDQLGEILEKYLKPSDNILQIGCGTSELASHLYDSGFRNVHSIDTDQGAINEQERKNKTRPELRFSVADASSLTSEKDESVSVVIDKGTLDALLPPDANSDQQNLVTSMFREVERVLAKGGRYMAITLAQEHILKFWYEHFSASLQVIMRIKQAHVSAKAVTMPVFVFIVQKLLKPMPHSMPLEMLYDKNRREVFPTASEVYEAVRGEQEFTRFIHLCSNKLEQEAGIVLEGPASPTAAHSRYSLTIVDNPKCAKIETMGVFIVPLGRDYDWLFSTEKGRRALALQAKKDRLIIAIPIRNYVYPDIETVKQELENFVCRFDPRQRGTIEFLTEGKVDIRNTVAIGESGINGKFAVEDVVISGKNYRRLLFTSSQNLIQSEALLKMNKKKKMVVDLDVLSCDHHSLMISSLALLDGNPLSQPEKVNLKIGVLGLGGGLLASFLLRNFAKVNVIALELDPAVVNIAAKYFAFPSNDKRVKVIVDDALHFLADSKDDEKLDALFVDVAGSMQLNGLSCPPPAFLDLKVIEKMKNKLKPKGLIALNLVTRDDNVAKSAIDGVRKVFPSLWRISSDEDVNQILIAIPGENTLPNVKELAKSLPKSWMSDIVDGVSRISIA